MTSDPAVIYESAYDAGHERQVADIVCAQVPNLQAMPTPKFHPFDFHLMRVYDRGSWDYWGGLEVKWFTHDSTRSGVFKFDKLVSLLACTLHRDDPNCYHRVAFRFTDGVLVSRAKDLSAATPKVFTRRDTGETDLVIRIQVGATPGTWIEVAT